MALSHKQQLKKKANKQKKRMSKNKTNVPVKISQLPIIESWQSDTVDGMTSICFARRISSLEYHISMYLLDTWALGVKDSFMQRVSFERYEQMMITSQRYKKADSGTLKSLIIDTVDFGHDNGFEPYGEYEKMLPYVSMISTVDSKSHDISFGDNGVVKYIPFPDESHVLVKKRLQTLDDKLGQGNYEFIAISQDFDFDI
jgi:hypothetical protein